jgi:hypothetical protein
LHPCWPLWPSPLAARAATKPLLRRLATRLLLRHRLPQHRTRVLLRAIRPPRRLLPLHPTRLLLHPTLLLRPLLRHRARASKLACLPHGKKKPAYGPAFSFA